MDIKCTGEALDPKANSPAPQLGGEGIWAADRAGKAWLTPAQPGGSGFAGPHLAVDPPTEDPLGPARRVGLSQLPLHLPSRELQPREAGACGPRLRSPHPAVIQTQTSVCHG